VATICLLLLIGADDSVFRDAALAGESLASRSISSLGSLNVTCALWLMDIDVS
jgi:hypothetical protein